MLEFDQGHAVALEAVAQVRLQLGQALRLVHRATERAPEGREVGVARQHADGLDIQAKHVVTNLPQRIVVPQQHHQRAVQFLDSGCQFLRGVEETAIADQHQARALRRTELGANPGRQAVTQGAVAGRV
ncbi:hypothetical protein D3C76_1549540 [compost metagenome]